jgi:hypothetical protein
MKSVYTWEGENWGRSLIYDAAKEGYTITVDSGGDEPDYVGKSPKEAWEAVTAVDSSNVILSKEGARREVAAIILENGQAGDEVINDYITGGWIDQWWQAKCKEADEQGG